jgi:regulator of replication initiation timing
LAGQVQLLEQSKLKLEMSMAAMKKEHRREISVKVIHILKFLTRLSSLYFSGFHYRSKYFAKFI